MKAVVVEVRGKKAAILCENGCVEEVRNRQYVVGKEIEYHTITPFYQTKRFIVSVASVLLLVCSGSGYVYAWSTPYSFISMDVNPSIEYALNRFDKVIGTQALNDDAKEMITIIQDSVYGENVEDAMMKTVEVLKEQSYFTDDGDNYIIFSVSSGSDEKMENLQRQLTDTSEDTKIEQLKIQTQVYTVTRSFALEAKKEGMSPGKRALLQQIKQQMPNNDIDMNTWGQLSVREIMRQAGEITGQSTMPTGEPGENNNTNMPGENNTNFNEGPTRDDPGHNDTDNTENPPNINNPNGEQPPPMQQSPQLEQPMNEPQMAPPPGNNPSLQMP